MNPIIRMMRRYIKTPLKYALPLLFIGALVLVSTSGCISPSNTSSSGLGTLAADNLTGAINDYYQTHNYTVNTPFTKTTENGKTVYKGAMQDTSSGITFDMTLYPTSTLSDALTLQDQKIASYEGSGYVGDFSNSNPVLWVGVLGGHTGVGILMFDTSVLNTPAVLVYTGTQ